MCLICGSPIDKQLSLIQLKYFSQIYATQRIMQYFNQNFLQHVELKFIQIKYRMHIFLEQNPPLASLLKHCLLDFLGVFFGKAYFSQNVKSKRKTR